MHRMRLTCYQCQNETSESHIWIRCLSPETQTKRNATQHGCLPSLLGDGDKRVEIVYGEENNILYSAN
jgi:hypothetical protein